MSWPSGCRPRSPRPLDLEKEPESIRELYGLNSAVTEPMGRKCLMARRMVERGVRFVQVFNSSWDSHFDLTKEHSRRGLETDRPDRRSSAGPETARSAGRNTGVWEANSGAPLKAAAAW